MSVPAFIDISEEDQAAELRAYLKSKGAEISEENSEGGLHVDLAQIIEACDVCLKEDDKDVESVMNSVVSLLLILEPDKQEALIESLCEKLVKFREGERPSLRLQLLSNLFHGMDKNTPVRYTVYCSLIKVAASCGAIQYIPTELDQVRKWISDWNLTTEKKHTLLRLLYEALVDCKKSDAASKVMVELLGSYTEDNASQARVDAHRCIVRALKDPNAFLFDHLLTLKPVKFLEGELIHDLLTIFVSAKLASYVKFYQNNKDFIDSLGLLHEQNMAKMRLLTFMGMAVENKEISFDTMQQELQIGADDVEAFVIDAVRTKMVYCKIDQTQRKVVVRGFCSGRFHFDFHPELLLRLSTGPTQQEARYESTDAFYIGLISKAEGIKTKTWMSLGRRKEDRCCMQPTNVECTPSLKMFQPYQTFSSSLNILNSFLPQGFLHMLFPLLKTLFSFIS
uniref:Eukaryotic translation initiation factor 3 subunit M n=4 Tax=Laurasiatheria TaxID=314145 RepID=A0A9L0JM61_EQUAS